MQYQTNTKLYNNTSKGNTYSYYDCNIPTNKTNYCPLPHEVDLEYGTELQPFYLLGTEQHRSPRCVSISEMEFLNNFSSQIAVLSHYPLPLCLWYSSPLSNNSKNSYQSWCNTVNLPLKLQLNWRCECTQKPIVYVLARK